ncbi:hypothetical protein AB0D49_39545 [Streptomyces sp. NPDC048290]|uniref:hypothetical protein n=1 Tax=Streptomyces sp. NPDC048290 TaxID=3155811 RepID=UPI003416A05C
MGYTLHAVIASEAVLSDAVRGLPAARLASIGQGLSLMPMTDALFDSVADGGGVGALGFWRLSEGFARMLAHWSAAGPVAYAEAEFFGGVGEQSAAVWDRGALVLGPLRIREGEACPAPGSPVSQALRRLGAVAGAGEDEFSAVGLDRHRHTGDWIG